MGMYQVRNSLQGLLFVTIIAFVTWPCYRRRPLLTVIAGITWSTIGDSSGTNCFSDCTHWTVCFFNSCWKINRNILYSGLRLDCAPCDAGYYCQEGSSTVTGPCDKGYYCPTNITNTYGSVPALIGSSSGTNCFSDCTHWTVCFFNSCWKINRNILYSGLRLKVI
jgi:hypothetical protein